MGLHRPSTSSSRGRFPDPARSTDPVTRALVSRLRTLQLGPAPDAAFRAELRAQLVAVTPRLVAEGVTAPAAAAPTTAFGQRLRAGLRHARRPLTVIAGFAAVFVLLLGGAVWMSSKTLPGDSLYNIKRASENVQLSLTSGDAARGHAYLDLAKKRVDEVAKLWSRATSSALGSGPQASGGADSRTTALITSTLGDADSDIRNAARLLTAQAVRDKKASDLTTLSRWAPDQISRLTAIVNAMPPGALHDRAASSLGLARRVLDRAVTLASQLGCGCLSSSRTDDLGPVPCTSCTAKPGAPSTPIPGSSAPGSSTPGTATTPGGSTSAPTPGGRTRSTTSPVVPGAGTSGGGRATTGGTGRGKGTGGGSAVLPIPSLPVTTPPAPITTNSCGVQISLGPIGVGVGSCGLGRTH